MSEETLGFPLTKQQSQRLNVMKLLFAIAIVFTHNNQAQIRFADEVISMNTDTWFVYYDFLLREGLSRSSLFGFMLMSSMFLYRKAFRWKGNMKKRIRSILLPYLIMNTFWVLAFFVGQALPHTRVFFRDPNNMVADFDIWRWLKVYGIGQDKPFLYPLWFMRNLFVLVY